MINDYWINITEKNPKKGETIIVHDSLYGVNICCYTYDGKWERIDTESYLYRVTHWMPLPSKPKSIRNNSFIAKWEAV